MSEATPSAASASAWAGLSMIDNTVNQKHGELVLNNSLSDPHTIAGIDYNQQLGDTIAVFNRGISSFTLAANDTAAAPHNRFASAAVLAAGGKLWLYYNGLTWEPFTEQQDTTATLGVIVNAASAAVPNDTDLVATVDTSVVKKITWTNVKAFLKTYFDTLYAPLGGSESLIAAGAITPSKRYSGIALVGAGAVTLAVPGAGMLGQLKVIEMTADNGDVTLALTNVVGQSSGTTATFNDVGDKLVLIGAASVWIVLKEVGIGLA